MPGKKRTKATAPKKSEHGRGKSVASRERDGSLQQGYAEEDGRRARPTTPKAAEMDSADREPGKFLVVGIGASAGGLEAMGELVAHVPIDHMAFIVVQHLAPHHESALAQLLARTSKVQVVTASDGTALERNHVYVIPPNADLAVMHGVIRLVTPPSPAGPRLPIDYLFRSLAQDQGPFAIGIVLSGTGTDGTFGIKAIKAAGGITFVQDPASAKYDGMPRSALASGSADFCLSPKEIGDELSRIALRPLGQRPILSTAATPQAQDQVGKLFLFIRSEFGNDLAHYKPATIERRIDRRMTLHKLERLEDYVKFVQHNRDELHALYNDMLITVTSFFRDPEVFEGLKGKVFPQLVASREQNAPIRVWVPACATGEEAYSIAICLLEFCEEKTRDTKIQVFATDIDDDSIQHARRGIYPANIAADVRPERLSRYFIKKDSEYHISRRVRDLVVFSKQNVLKDAPFSRMDLASCRNLLIYLQPASQKKVLRILHYALNPSGYLLLGSSETVGDAPELFSLADRKSKIYSKKHVPSQAALDMNLGASLSIAAPQPPVSVRPTPSLQGAVDRKVLELYGPSGVVINEDLEILQFRGHTGPYLDPAPGSATLNLLKLARFELHIELKRTIQQALARHMRVTVDVAYQEANKQRAVKLDVVPLQEPETKARCLIVLFQEMASPTELPAVSSVAAPTDEASLALVQRNQQLERELAVTKEYLQTTLEDRESTYEELKSANEELQSSNEELQSTNEELETSKEEMQSTNEELTTVNEELQTRMAELSLTNDDLHNVLTGIDNAVVIVGMDLRIRRYTLAAERLFNLVPGDIGRSVNFLDTFVGASLEAKVSSIIQSLSTVEEEVHANNQRWYSLRITPYKTLDHSIRGALLSLSDIDVRKRAADMTRDVGSYAAKFLAAIGHPLLIVDVKLRVIWTNEAFLSTFQLSKEETIGSLLTSLGTRQWADPGLRERLDRTFASAVAFRDYEMRLRFQDVGEVVMKVGGGQIPGATETRLVLVSIEPRHLIPRGTP